MSTEKTSKVTVIGIIDTMQTLCFTIISLLFKQSF